MRRHNKPSPRPPATIVQDGEGRVKIGKTVKLSDRIKEYTKLPTQPIVLHTFLTDNYDEAEKLIHERYAEQRLRGEWFALTEKDIAFIKSGDLERVVIMMLPQK